MNSVCIAILAALIATVVSATAFPIVLRFAKKNGIVDCPNERKLQRVPIPVLGGVVVYLGLLLGGLVLMLLMPNTLLMWGLVAMTAMLVVGTWDDIKDLSVLLRLLIEIIVVSAFILRTNMYINDLHGLWDIWDLSLWIGISLSVLVGVGVINAINLIDGVDGYASGYGMMACFCFVIAFGVVSDFTMMCLASIAIGALFPFFLHNVFGLKSKMFIGDGGTLMLGMLIVVMSFCLISNKYASDLTEQRGLCIPAFLVALGCIPLFDTLRVMSMRILRGVSPFKPDKTHLHHLFIDMGFSHLGAALFLLFINAMVILGWFLTWKIGFSMDVQMSVVFILGLFVTFGFYKFMKIQQNSGPIDAEGYPEGTKLWHIMCRFGNWTHRENKRLWQMASEIIDSLC